jgi:hypothetical protein
VPLRAAVQAGRRRARASDGASSTASHDAAFPSARSESSVATDAAGLAVTRAAAACRATTAGALQVGGAAVVVPERVTHQRSLLETGRILGDGAEANVEIRLRLFVSPHLRRNSGAPDSWLRKRIGADRARDPHEPQNRRCASRVASPREESGRRRAQGARPDRDRRMLPLLSGEEAESPSLCAEPAQPEQRRRRSSQLRAARSEGAAKEASRCRARRRLAPQQCPEL